MTLHLVTRTVRPEHCDPLYLLRTLKDGQEYCALLESADRNHGRQDFSFLALGARDVVTVHDGKCDGALCRNMSASVDPSPFGSAQGDMLRVTPDPLQPFFSFIGQGRGLGLGMGYIGFLSYESTRLFDAIDLPTDPTVPDALFVLPEVLIKMDHEKKEVTIVAHADTKEDLDAIEHVIRSSPFRDDTRERLKRERTTPLPSLEDIAPLRQVSREEFCRRAEKAKEAVYAGEAFQIVLSQELLLPSKADPLDAYEQLRAINPSPYMFYFETPLRILVGASPETLIRVQGRHMLYRPIAGTRKRTGDRETDALMRRELESDAKERAEHQMLVDLGRNDVGRVAKIGSVAVEDPFHIEEYAHVFHIVSDVHGELAEGKTSLDALRSVFPAGTLTGAPKLRAMEIIRDLEASPRGVYGGAFGYIDACGDLDLAITIRTMAFTDQGISLRVGAGIVRDSVPEHEDNECLHKARSCLAAINLASSRS